MDLKNQLSNRRKIHSKAWIGFMENIASQKKKVKKYHIKNKLT